MVTREQLGEFKDEAIRQFHEANWLGKVAVTGAAITLTAEWLLNEAIVGTAGGQMLAHTHNALQTMAATGATSTVEQVIFGTSAAFAISQVPRLMDKARDTFYEAPTETANIEERFDEALQQHPALVFAGRALRKFGRGADKTLEAFSLGVALPMFLRNAKETHDFGSNMGQVGRYSVVIGIGNFALAGAIVGIVGLGEATGAQGAANFIVGALSNPLLWAGGFGLYRGRKVIIQTVAGWLSHPQPPLAS